VSVSTTVFLPGDKCNKLGAVVNLLFNSSNVSSCDLPQWNFCGSHFNFSVIGLQTFEKSLIDHWSKFVNLLKIWTSLTDLGWAQFWTLFTFLSLMVTPLVLTMYHRNWTSSCWNTDFVNETARLCCSSRSRTCWTCLIWSFIFSDYIRISSR